jgi:hypothetical protein
LFLLSGFLICHAVGWYIELKNQKFYEARAFNFTYRYIDDVLSINNSRFAEFLPLIYPPELEVKETTDTSSSASFLDLYLELDDSGQISTKIYHWYADDLLKQYSSKGDKYVIDEELQHTDHLFLGVACFTFMNLTGQLQF